MNILKKTFIRLQTFFSYRELFFQLVSREIKLKYRRSILGYVWSILNPLLIMLVKVAVFSLLFDRRIPFFPVYIISGHMLFSFMTGATSRALSSITGNAGILKKVYVPKYVFTLASTTSELITFFFSLGALLIVVFFTRAPLTLRFIFNIIPLVQVYIFCFGLGLFLAQAAVFFKDVVHIWSVITTAWMYLSAIFYPVDILPEKVQYLVTHFNPLYFYIAMFRGFTIGGEDVIIFMIRGAIAAGLMLIIGISFFSYNKNKFILYI